MRHFKKGKKFGRNKDQRKALLKSIASSFFIYDRIRTTKSKAKEARPFLEKYISRAKNPTVTNIRFLRKTFSAETVKKITKQAENLKERQGGYTRVVKLEPRRRDGAKMAIIELVR